MLNRSLFVLSTSALLLSACSSRPREFVAAVNAAPDGMAAYQADHEKCRVLVAKGQRSGFGRRVASGTLGAAAGVGATAVAVSGGSVGLGAAAAAAATAVVVLPVVGIAAAWGVAKAQKRKKEREVKDAMALCLSEQGYEITDWVVAKGKKVPLVKAGAPLPVRP